MKNLRKRFAVCMTLAIMVVIAISSTCLGAIREKNDIQFVDAVNHLGYYVDVSTIDKISDTEFTVEVTMVQPKGNLKFVYNTKFNTKDMSYQYLDSHIYRYDTKELIGTHDQPTIAQSYISNSPIREVEEFCVDWKRTHIN